MKSLTTTIKAGMWMLLCSLLITACSNEDLLESNPKEYTGKAIQLFAIGPDNHTVSRASNVKEGFNTDDIIHISTTFTLIDANNIESTSTVYSCLKYQANKAWKEEGTSTFNWPWNATKASFTAYYIPATGAHKNDSPLNTGDVPPINLSDLTQQVKGEDPLMATYANVAAGSSVYLQFNHIFSKVTFTKLEAATNEEFRLIADCNKVITFTRKASDELEYATSAITDKNYIANTATDTKEITFLIPELPQNAKIKLARKDMSAYHSLELPKNFESGKHYIIDVTQLADNFVSDAVKEDDWNDAANEMILDSDGIQKYLLAIQNGTECVINGRQILVLNKEGKENIVVQICNVDFKNQPFEPVNLRNSIIFQGNGYKIKNLRITKSNFENEPDKKDGAVCKALFGRNSGVIKNLVIEGATWEAGSTIEKYAGILTGVNYNEINNVTINGVSIDNTPAEYVGTLVGFNNQNIANCRVTGDIALNVNQEGDKTVYIGGFIGSSSGSGGISNCEVQGNDSKKEITIKGKNQIGYIGGFAGFAEKIDDCSTNMDVKIENGTTATNKLYVGGFVGRAERLQLKNNTSIGNIDYSSSLINVLIGGFSGSLQNITVHNCAAGGELTSSSVANQAQGGFVGSVEANTGETIIRYSSTTGNMPTTVGAFIGTITKDKGTLTIGNSFCINSATDFILAGKENATVDNCHQNGIGSDGNSFIPMSIDHWTNTPAIYGKDKNGQEIYYLKRNSIKE